MPTTQKLTPDAVRKAIAKTMGKDSIKFASDPSLRLLRVPSGVLAFDELMHGGVVRGRFLEIYGPEGIGKSALAMMIVAAVQKQGGLAAWVDCEHRFHAKFAKSLGVDIKALDYHEQESGPQAIDFMTTLLKSHLWNVIVLDSIASLLPKEEHDKSISAGSMGMEQAKLMSKALRILTTANPSQGAIVVMLNQTREAVGVMFGDKTTTSGGRAMRFYATTRIEMVRTQTIKREVKEVDQKTGEISKVDKPAAHRIMIRVRKDSTGVREGDSTTVVFDYDLQGFDRIEDLIYVGRMYGLVGKGADPRKKTKPKKGSAKAKAGPAGKSWWWVDDYQEQAVNGKNAFRDFLVANPKIADELQQWILNSITPEEEA